MSTIATAFPEKTLTALQLVEKFRIARREMNEALRRLDLLNPPAPRPELYNSQSKRPISVNPGEPISVRPEDGDIVHEPNTEFGPSIRLDSNDLT